MNKANFLPLKKVLLSGETMGEALWSEHMNSCLELEFLLQVSLCAYRCGHYLLESNNGIISK